MKKSPQKKLNPLIERYQDEKRWVNYSIVKVPGRNTSTKVPFSPITHRKASSTNSSDWGTYEQALTFRPEAIGIVFTPSQTLLGIDIDKCLEKGTNTISHEQKEKIAQLITEADTYTEISPSGTGLHLFLEINEPLHLEANRHANFEVYTSGRYFTVTGNPYKEAKEIRKVSQAESLQFLSIIGYPWGKESKEEYKYTVKAEDVKNHTLPLLSSKNLLDKMFNSKKGKQIKDLYEGRSTQSIYKGDESVADMALLSHLAFWTEKNPALMESIWLASPLGAREKTQKRKDYRDRSIATAIAHCSATFENKKAKLEEQIKKEAPELNLLFIMKGKEKTFIQNMENIARILQFHPNFKNRLQYDVFKNTLEIKYEDKVKNIEDHDILKIQSTISILFPMFGKVGKEMVYDAIIKVARDNTIDSAIDYIKSIKWDETERLKEWLQKTYHTDPRDEKYYKAVGENWMKGLIKRICLPGCQFDYVLVLEGEQGIKKSTSLGIIGNVYPDQPNWHVETTMSTDNKDFFMQFQGKAIIEFSEGETLSRSEVKKMKAIITTRSDKYRPAYGRFSVDFARRCVFAMTTNQIEYLKDETGNRRWLPVACNGDVDVEWLADNRDQLFAEAYHRVITLREQTWEFPKEETLEMQSARRIHNPNQDLIADWYLNKLTEADRENGVTVHQVYRDAIYGGFVARPLGRFDAMEIADVLKTHLKLDKRRKRIDGIQSMRWFADEKSMKSAEALPLTELEKF